jgi:hypothetical protein
MNLHTALWLLASVAFVGTACGGKSSTGPSPEENAASGTYQLTSVRGAPLPVPLFGQCSLGHSQPCAVCSASASSGSVTLEAGEKSSDPNAFSITLSASGPCVDPQGVSPTNTSSYTTGASGTWTTSGSTITFTIGSNPMGISTATLSGSTLSMSFNWSSPDPGGQSAPVTAVFTK